MHSRFNELLTFVIIIIFKPKTFSDLIYYRETIIL